MNRRKKIASLAFTGAAAATAAVGMGITPAYAAPANHLWTITPGGSYTASNTTPTILKANGASAVCSTGTVHAAGNLVHSVSGSSPVLGIISASATFGTASKPCSLDGFRFTAHLEKTVNLVGFNEVGGVTSGAISGSISATITPVGATAACAAVQGTSVPASYINSSTLNINKTGASTLHFGNVSAGGCSSNFTSGEPAAFIATFKVMPPQVVTES